MRIISGTAKGTKLYTLEGLETRPTLDRVKESLFNIIYDKAIDSTVLDLFSGSGAIGLEFASRGAKKVYLCDKSKDACKIIEKNIEKTHLEEKVKLLNMDFIKTAIKELIETEVLTEETLIIAETDEEERITKQIEEFKGIEIVDKRKYGRAYVLFLKKMNGKEE